MEQALLKNACEEDACRVSPEHPGISQSRESLWHQVEKLRWPEQSWASSTIIWAAWSILAARYNDSRYESFDVAQFFLHFNSRESKFETHAFRPVSLQLDLTWDKSLDEFLQQVQSQALSVGTPCSSQVQSDSNDAACPDHQNRSRVLVAVQATAPDPQLHPHAKDLEKACIDGNARDATFPEYAMTLVCQPEPWGMRIHADFDPVAYSREQVLRLSKQFEHVLRQICAEDLKPLSLRDVEAISEQDKIDIWTWNSTVPEMVDGCMHDLISHNARQRPDAPAICAWDGELTYGQLEQDSTRLAHHLVRIGVKPGMIIPLCFEKSMWTTVAIMAVMKAGAASVLLHTSLPEDRLRIIVQQVEAKLILSSAANQELASRLGNCKLVVLDHKRLEQSRLLTDPKLPTVKPSDKLYVVFTSGSTGIPKGVVISHSNFRSTVKHQQSLMGLNTASRVYDFASYAFSMAWGNILYALAVGGCLCVPSDQDRNSDLVGSIHRLKANWVLITPSVARLLDPTKVPGLKTLNFGGEPLTAQDVLRWKHRAALVTSAYGNSECTGHCTIVETTGEDPRNRGIGYGAGHVTWVVDPDDGRHLAPVGAVGELWLEGPSIGHGYLDNDQRTAASFINDPPWMLRGCSGVPGRHGRAYRTGDLVRYNANGTLSFVGRKDTQVKLRGQRIELGEIEHYVHQCLDDDANLEIKADVIIPNESSNPTLVAFMAVGDPAFNSEEKTKAILRSIVPRLNEKLSKLLPSYMIPWTYIPVAKMPMGATGKLDRLALRKLGGSMTLEQLAALSTSKDEKRQPTTEAERKLQQLWAMVLGIDQSNIGLDDSFWSLGGDSIAAMRVVRASREQGISVTATELLGPQRLCDMAAELDSTSRHDAPAADQIEPFSLLPGVDTRSAVNEAAAQCNVDPDLIVDIYPCTPLQEGMMAASQKKAAGNVVREVLRISAEADITRLRAAWEKILSRNKILRTRIVLLKTLGFMQVVTRDHQEIKEATSLEQCLGDSTAYEMELGTSLCTVTFVEPHEGHGRYVVWTVHHSICDGYQTELILAQVERAYRGESMPPEIGFNTFIRYIKNRDVHDAKKFWSDQLRGSSETQLVGNFKGSHIVWANDSREQQLTLRSPRIASGFPLSTILRLAWAYVLGFYTESTDVTFGAVVMGRGVPVPGIEELIGPTIATVPIRMKMDLENTVKEALQLTHDQARAMIPFEQMGLQNIRTLGPDPARACEFQTLLVVQPPEPPRDNCIQVPERTAGDRLAYGSFPLLMECNINRAQTGARILAIFDDHVFDGPMIERLLYQYAWVVKQMCDEPDLRLSDIDKICPEDAAQIAAWNDISPISIDRTLNETISERSAEHPDSVAVQTSTLKTTYAELEDLSSRLAAHLRGLGVGPEVLVPLSVDRTPNQVIAAIAILKAGGAVVNIESTQPVMRRKQIVDCVNARIAVLCGDDYDETLWGGVQTVRITREWLQNLPQVSNNTWNRDCRSSAFVIFTSGSTGQPKAIVLEHRNIASSVLAHGRFLEIRDTSRMLQVASCAFDLWIYEHMTTLISGGCVCVPSQQEKMDSLDIFAQKVDTTTAITTPTILRAVNPVPCLQNIGIIGEQISSDIVDRWGRSAKLFNAYGPAETAGICSASVIDTERQPLATIGKALGCVLWICQPDDPSKLAPIGTVGELLIQGPIVARGYLNNETATSSAFLEDLPWLSRFKSTGKGRLYRSGDLVRYNNDGSLVYISRRDTQVKIRGFRVELGEIEYYLQSLLGMREVVVETVHPAGSESSQLLAFLQRDDVGQEANVDGETIILPAEYRVSQAGKVLEQLSTLLPSYMVPSAIIPVRALPKTASDKTDRKALRAAVAGMSPEALATYYAPRTFEAPQTDDERHLCSIWAAVLNLEPASISRTDSFLRLGGDSMSAMKLVTSARENNKRLSVANILQKPFLAEMAGYWEEFDTSRDAQTVDYTPFTLLDCPDVSRFLADVVEGQWAISRANVVDVLPASFHQTLELRAALPCFTFTFGPEIDLDRVIDSWLQVVRSHETLRTVFIPWQHGHLQVVLKDLPPVIDHHTQPDVTADRLIKEQESQGPLKAGKAPYKMMTLRGGDQSQLILCLSHALYDGTCLQDMLDDWSAAYASKPCLARPSMRDRIYHAKGVGPNGGSSYFRTLLAGAEITYCGGRSVSRFPQDPRVQPVHLERQADGIRTLEDITMASMVKAAWSLSLMKHRARSDVVFFEILAARRTGRPAVDDAVGGCLQYIPVRLVLDPTWTLAEVCKTVQRQSIDSSYYEQMDLFDIMRECTGWPLGINLGSTVMHQIKDLDWTLKLGDAMIRPRAHMAMFASLFVEVATVELGGNRLGLELGCMDDLLDQQTASSVIDDMARILQTMSRSPQTPVRDVL
ncbi:hypothetical protein VTN02DRAFT_2387 [Thermoascus thermophilus]